MRAEICYTGKIGKVCAQTGNRVQSPPAPTHQQQQHRQCVYTKCDIHFHSGAPQTHPHPLFHPGRADASNEAYLAYYLMMPRTWRQSILLPPSSARVGAFAPLRCRYVFLICSASRSPLEQRATGICTNVCFLRWDITVSGSGTEIKRTLPQYTSGRAARLRNVLWTDGGGVTGDNHRHRHGRHRHRPAKPSAKPSAPCLRSALCAGYCGFIFRHRPAVRLPSDRINCVINVGVMLRAGWRCSVDGRVRGAISYWHYGALTVDWI